jgi:tRNA threonylcarbamoyladenosine biosynthesis protein TsaE
MKAHSELLSNFLADANATRAAGERLGRSLQQQRFAQPLLITLTGDLGAGKTTFVAGLIRALGHEGAVRSPTYTLIEPYEFSGLSIFHLDLYRLMDPSQLEDLGWRDLLQPDTVLLVEWPEKAGDMLGPADLSLTFSYPTSGLDGRSLTLHSLTANGERLLTATGT